MTDSIPTFDRSELELWASCPQSAWLRKKHRTSVGEIAEAGTQVHDAISRCIDNYIAAQGMIGPQDITNNLERELWAARPDVQPETLAAMRRSVWSFGRFLSDNHFKNILRFDGGLGDQSGQLTHEFEGLGCRVTAELDLLLASPAKQEVDVYDWKGLPLDTPIPTPAGWTTMGELHVGDHVFDSRGVICRVIGKSAPSAKKCLRFRFDDRSTVVCDVDHLWRLTDRRVVSANDITLDDRIAVAMALELPEAELPIDPYVLGLWLGDGKHSSGEITKPDDFIWEEINRRGYSAGANYQSPEDGSVAVKCRAHTVIGLIGKLRSADLLRHKHIPALYFRASFRQRLDLLRGLMDSDGNANPARDQAVFTSTNKELSDNVMELLLTLGQRPLQSEVTAHGFGKDVIAYPISFRPIFINPFLLPRKADRLSLVGDGKSWRRKIQGIDDVGEMITQCIGVDSPDNTYLCTRHMIPTHNSGWKQWRAADVKKSFQFQMQAWLVLENYPDVEMVRVTIWNLRENRQSYSVEFLRKDRMEYEVRVRSAAQIAMTNAASPLRPDGWPTTEKCPLCSVAALCDVGDQVLTDVAANPEAWVDRLVALDARVTSITSLLADVVEARGEDIETPSGHRFGTRKAKKAAKPKAVLYSSDEAGEDAPIASDNPFAQFKKGKI